MKTGKTIEMLKEMKSRVFHAARRNGFDRVHFQVELDEVKDFIENLDTAIQALEKQIPIKPKYYIDNWDHNRPGCPGCPRNEILYAGQKYCSVCGTKIDWGEDRE